MYSSHVRTRLVTNLDFGAAQSSLRFSILGTCTLEWPTDCPLVTYSTVKNRNGSNGSATTNTKSSFQLGLPELDDVDPMAVLLVLKSCGPS
ncbi:hypothetical protein ACFX13_013998 [Malus domestica]